MEDLKNMLKESIEFYLAQQRSIAAQITSLPKGNIRQKKIGREIYYYLQYRKGKKVIDEYIGKKIPEELRKSLIRQKQLKIEFKKIKEGLKMLGINKTGEIEFILPLQKFFRIITKEKLWEEGIEIIGSWCFMLYQKYLPLPPYPLRTQDIDILIPLPYNGKNFDLYQALKQLGFQENFNPDNSTFFVGYGIKIEFLAPERGRESHKAPYIPPLGITPQLLRFMDILLKEKINLNISRGIKIRVPSPASFFLHKILIADRRKEEGKREKDFRQVIHIGRYILQTEDERIKMLNIYTPFSPSWKKRIDNSLESSKKLFPMEEATINALKILLK